MAILSGFNRYTLMIQSAIFVGLVTASEQARAANDFSDISRNITDSIEDLPGLLAALSYLFGLLLGVLGILKIKDHVENPTQTPLKDGSIRMAAGGALFGLPIVFEAMETTIGATTNSIGPAKLKKVEFTTI